MHLEEPAMFGKGSSSDTFETGKARLTITTTLIKS